MRNLFNILIFLILFYVGIYGIETLKQQHQAFASEPNNIFIVEVISYLNKKNAMNRVLFLKNKGYPADFIKLKASENGGNKWYVVHLGYYTNRKKAEQIAKRYKSEFINQSYIIKSYPTDFLKERAGGFSLWDTNISKKPDTSVLLNIDNVYLTEIVSYLDKKDALNRIAFLNEKGYSADFIKLKASEDGKFTWYVVHLGYCANKKEAEELGKKYKFDFSNQSYIIKAYSSDFIKERAGIFQSQDKTSNEIISDIEIWADSVESENKKIKKNFDF